MTRSFQYLLEMRRFASLARESLLNEGRARIAGDVNDMSADIEAWLRQMSRPHIDAVAAEVVS